MLNRVITGHEEFLTYPIEQFAKKSEEFISPSAIIGDLTKLMPNATVYEFSNPYAPISKEVGNLLNKIG